MNLILRLALSAVLVVSAEAAYNASGWGISAYLSPFLALQAAAFIGLTLGPGPALWWGACAGLLEEFYLAQEGDAAGLIPVIYLWTGWLAGRIFYGRAEIRSAAVAVLVTSSALASGLIEAAVLSWLYGRPVPILSGPWTWCRTYSVIAQNLWAPLLAPALGWAMLRGGRRDD